MLLTIAHCGLSLHKIKALVVLVIVSFISVISTDLHQVFTHHAKTGKCPVVGPIIAQLLSPQFSLSYLSVMCTLDIRSQTEELAYSAKQYNCNNF